MPTDLTNMDLKLFAYTSDRYLHDYSLLTSLSLENLLSKIRHIFKTRILSYNQNTGTYKITKQELQMKTKRRSGELTIQGESKKEAAVKEGEEGQEIWRGFYQRQGVSGTNRKCFV